MTTARSTPPSSAIASITLISLVTMLFVSGCLKVDVPDSTTHDTTATSVQNTSSPSGQDSNVMIGTPHPATNGSTGTSSASPSAVLAPCARPYPYEFNGITQWFNLDNVSGLSANATTLSRCDLRGKVVLVDFWTYSCINCIRTLPYTESYYKKYGADGLVVVGVHAPEFAFEHDPDNVAKAIAQYNITYPVGLDNDYLTWKAYGNNYWPHVYLFNKNGKLVFDHIGEGGYDEIEQHIQALLALPGPLTEVPEPDFSMIASSEIYLGPDTNRGNAGYALDRGQHAFAAPQASDRLRNTVYLNGTWTLIGDHIEANAGAHLFLQYNARDFHVVAGGNGTITPTIDGVVGAPLPISDQKLYTLSSTAYTAHDAVLAVSPGVDLYTFTFG